MRAVALVVALAHLGLGLLGCLPPAHVEWEDAPDDLSVRNGIGLLLGKLPNNLVLTVVRLGIGLGGLAAARSAVSAAWFLRGVSAGYGLLIGLALTPAGAMSFGVAPIAGANLWLHLGVAVAAGLAGWSPAARRALRTPRLPRRACHPAVCLAHRLLAPFPLVFFVGAVLTDLAYWWTTRPWYNGSGAFWARASAWQIGAGVVAGVLAALIGAYAWWRGRRQPSDRLLGAHVVAGTVALTCGAGNIVARAIASDVGVIPVGIALSAIGAVALTLAYLGGLVTDARGAGQERRSGEW